MLPSTSPSTYRSSLPESSPFTTTDLPIWATSVRLCSLVRYVSTEPTSLNLLPARAGGQKRALQSQDEDSTSQCAKQSVAIARATIAEPTSYRSSIVRRKLYLADTPKRNESSAVWV